MKPNRRSFIRQAATGMLAGLGADKIAQAMPAMPPLMPGKAGDANDEAYWRMLRKQFPLSPDLIYLNNGTLGPSPYPVIEAVKKAMMNADVEVNYSGWEKAMGKLAAFTGADDSEIALTHNVTEGLNIMCWGLPLQKGDEVIMTTHEHAGNAIPWLNRRKLHGIVIRTFAPAATAAETLNRIDALINKKTRAIAVPHIPCTQGQVFPVKEIAQLGKSKGLFVCIDGAHGPGMIPLDMHDIGCDAYASCGHKWLLGSKGTGFLYVSKAFRDTLQPYFVGSGSDNATWNMNAAVPEMGAYAANGHRYFGGTQSAALFAGVEAAVDFMSSIGMEQVHAYVSMLGKYMQDSLLELGDRVEMLTPVEAQSRCAMIGFRLRNVDYEKFYKAALENRMRIRFVPENKLNLLRVSTHIYNNKAEIDAFVGFIKKYKE